MGRIWTTYLDPLRVADFSTSVSKVSGPGRKTSGPNKGTANEEDGTRKKSDLRILVLEDNDMNCAVLAGYLEALGYSEPERLTTLEELESLMPRILAMEYDLIVMDIMLPDGESTSLAWRISQQTPVPTVAYTARTGPQWQVAMKEAGFLAVLEKPLSMGAIDYHLRQIFEAPT
ncbi:MAG: response regulator [Pseudomonadota bacterium]